MADENPPPLDIERVMQNVARARPPAPAPAEPPRQIEPYGMLKEAVDALPFRLIIAIRESARQVDAVEEWDAVERAADAFVSAREYIR